MNRSPHDSASAWQPTRAPTGAAVRGGAGHSEHTGAATAHDGEIFAAGPAAEALQLQFERHPSAFVAVHALGGPLPAHLAAAVIAGSKLPGHTLAIRRQGIGSTLATIDYAEWPAAQGAAERVYSTHAAGDDPARRPIAGTLLAFSRLCVVLVGTADAQALDDSFGWLRERLHAMPWPNRQLLVVPMVAGLSELASQVRELIAGTAVAATTTSYAAHPAAAWAHLQTAWGVVRGGRVAEPSAPTGPPTTAWPTSTMKAVHGAAGPATIAPQRLMRYAQACAAMRGAIDVCLFRIVDRKALAHAGRAGDAQALAAQGATLLASAIGASAALGSRSAVVETQVALDATILVARTVPRQQGLGMLAVYDRTAVNPATLGLQLQRLEALLGSH